MTESITQKLDNRDTVSWLMQVSLYTCSCGNAASADTTARYKVKQKYNKYLQDQLKCLE